VRMASNRNVMAWTFMGNTRMHQVLREKGNKLSHVGIFTFEVSADGTISETGTAISTILPYVKKWPHIKWLLTIMNHGTASIFTALRENTNGAQDTFLSEIVRIIDKYPWCSGIDIDSTCISAFKLPCLYFSCRQQTPTDRAGQWARTGPGWEALTADPPPCSTKYPARLGRRPPE